MLSLRKLDGAGWRGYLDELRPRLLVVRVRAGRLRFAWLVPLWPFEQVLGMLLAAAVLAQASWPWWSGAAGARGARWRARLADVASMAGSAAVGERERPTPSALIAALSAIAGANLGDALRLPSGVPYLSVRSREATVDVTAY